MLLYLVVVNIVGLLIMKWDKHLAKKQKWRIPEKRIWFIAIIGGALGATIGMFLFRHKTKHMSFSLLLPLLTIGQFILLFYWQFYEFLS